MIQSTFFIRNILYFIEKQRLGCNLWISSYHYDVRVLKIKLVMLNRALPNLLVKKRRNCFRFSELRMWLPLGANLPRN